MRRTASVVGIILVVGLIAFQIPADAGSTLEGRVARLEDQVYALKWKVSTLKTEVSAVKAQTSQLNSFGTYTGDVEGNQVQAPMFCSGGTAAVWDAVYRYLDC